MGKLLVQKISISCTVNGKQFYVTSMNASCGYNRLLTIDVNVELKKQAIYKTSAELVLIYNDFHKKIIENDYDNLKCSIEIKTTDSTLFTFRGILIGCSLDISPTVNLTLSISSELFLASLFNLKLFYDRLSILNENLRLGQEQKTLYDESISMTVWNIVDQYMNRLKPVYEKVIQPSTQHEKDLINCFHIQYKINKDYIGWLKKILTDEENKKNTKFIGHSARYEWAVIYSLSSGFTGYDNFIDFLFNYLYSNFGIVLYSDFAFGDSPGVYLQNLIAIADSTPEQIKIDPLSFNSIYNNQGRFSVGGVYTLDNTEKKRIGEVWFPYYRSYPKDTINPTLIAIKKCDVVNQYMMNTMTTSVTNPDEPPLNRSYPSHLDITNVQQKEKQGETALVAQKTKISDWWLKTWYNEYKVRPNKKVITVPLNFSYQCGVLYEVDVPSLSEKFNGVLSSIQHHISLRLAETQLTFEYVEAK